MEQTPQEESGHCAVFGFDHWENHKGTAGNNTVVAEQVKCENPDSYF